MDSVSAIGGRKPFDVRQNDVHVHGATLLADADASPGKQVQKIYNLKSENAASTS